MMAKDIEIEVVEIDLGIDIKQEILAAAKDISGRADEIATQIVSEKVEEKNKLDESKRKKKKEGDEWTTKMESCHELLSSKMNADDPFVTSVELLEIAGIENLTTLMLRLKNFLKRIGNEHSIEKKKKNKQNIYRLVTIEPE